MYGLQGTDEKWTSCDGWAQAQPSTKDALEFSTGTRNTVLRYTAVHYTSIGIQYQNDCGLVDKLQWITHTR